MNMNKSFTKEDIIKKHETNIKSALGGFPLAGVLGLIYIVRYFITGNFDFHFSLSIPEMMLKLSHWGEISKALAYAVTAVFVLIYFALIILNVKNQKWLKVSLALYLVDFAALLIFMFGILGTPDSAMYIEVIVHFFIILFLTIAVYSDKKLKELKK